MAPANGKQNTSVKDENPSVLTPPPPSQKTPPPEAANEGTNASFEIGSLSTTWSVNCLKHAKRMEVALFRGLLSLGGNVLLCQV